jgi:hypothetical protein
MGKPEGKKHLGRRTRRWKDVIKIRLPRNRRENADWIGVGLAATGVEVLMNLWVSWNEGNFVTG